MTSNISLKIKFQNIIFPKGAAYINRILKKDNLSTIFRVLKSDTIKESTLVTPSIEISNQIIEKLF